MVTVTGYQNRVNEDGAPYVSLILQGELEMIRSSNSANFYAHRKKCFIYSTFDEQAAKDLIGQQIPGSIVKVHVEPYEYQIPGTNETVLLDYKWSYSADENASHTLEQLPLVADELESEIIE